MRYTLAEAAQATGMSKITILHALAQGKVCGTRNETYDWLIEPTALHRVYPRVEPRVDRDPLQRGVPELKAQVAARLGVLREASELLNAWSGKSLWRPLNECLRT